MLNKNIILNLKIWVWDMLVIINFEAYTIRLKKVVYINLFLNKQYIVQ